MKRNIIIGTLLFIGLTYLSARDTVPFNSNWKFARFGPMPDGTTLEEPKDIDQPEYDDADWRVLNVPHDWGIEGPFRAEFPNRTGKLPWAGIG